MPSTGVPLTVKATAMTKESEIREWTGESTKAITTLEFLHQLRCKMIWKSSNFSLGNKVTRYYLILLFNMGRLVDIQTTLKPLKKCTIPVHKRCLSLTLHAHNTEGNMRPKLDLFSNLSWLNAYHHNIRVFCVSRQGKHTTAWRYSNYNLSSTWILATKKIYFKI